MRKNTFGITFISIALAGVSLNSGIAYGSLDDDVRACQSIDEVSERLNCYDDLSPAPVIEVEEGFTGNWRTELTESAMDDSRGATLLLQSSNTFADSIGRPISAHLVIRCSENTTNLYINFGRFLGSSSSQIRFRIDDQPPRSETWSLSTNSEAMFANNDIGLIRQLMPAHSLVVQTTPYGSNPIQATFTLDGLLNAISPVQQACGWN